MPKVRSFSTLRGSQSGRGRREERRLQSREGRLLAARGIFPLARNQPNEVDVVDDERSRPDGPPNGRSCNRRSLLSRVRERTTRESRCLPVCLLASLSVCLPALTAALRTTIPTKRSYPLVPENKRAARAAAVLVHRLLSFISLSVFLFLPCQPFSQTACLPFSRYHASSPSTSSGPPVSHYKRESCS